MKKCSEADKNMESKFSSFLQVLLELPYVQGERRAAEPGAR